MEAPPDVVPSVEAPVDKADDAATKSALTPPTSEDLDKRDERMSSELSELDSDDDEEIEPDHYWDGGKIPIFKPTMDQFRNFKKFIDKIDKYGMKSGIVKVIPPAEWRDSLPDLTEAVKTIRVKNPIMQEFAGQHGIYTQANIEKQRAYNLPEWKAVTMESHHQPPAKRGERRRAAAEAPSRTRSTRAQASSANTNETPPPKRAPARTRRRQSRKEVKEEADEDGDDDVTVPPTPKSPEADERQTTPAPKPRGRQPRGEQKKSTASRRMNNRTVTADYVDEKAFKGFNYRLENVDEYTPERCKELEENYWKTINYGQPMYGADMPGSLFDDRTTSWNVAKLPNLLDVLGTKVPGVNTAYLYLGMWKATFAWHLEDVDLYSINYIHFGAPKQWYSISQEDARRFEAAMKNIWPNDAKNCSQFLRHKTYLISPQQLEKQYNIKVNRLVHYEGEFVITYPYGYHSGYNIGYNCAESVNFANESWLSYGRIAKKCECEADSVWVDVNEIERKLRGEPTPEYYEETDSEDEEGADHLPSPPPSVAGKPKSKAARRLAGNKRKRGNDESKDAPKPKKVRRIRIRIKVPGRGMPCVLCPNDIEFDELLPTDNGMKAHRLCADYTPETFISSKNGVETVCNVANIGKDRLELKCNYCRSKRGAVFQCSQKKCTRAFHATCAAAAGVQVDLGPMPTFDEEGTEYFYDGYDFRCRFHRPKKRNAKTVDVDFLEKDKFIMKYAKTLKPKDVVQFQYVGGEMYQIHGGLVVENRPGEQALLVDVLPDGDRCEIEWKYLLKLDPEESQRPKPSANAKPLPEHLKENDASLDMSNRTDGVPEMGDPFHDPNSEQKWAEFNTAPEVTQKLDKVSMDKENHLWYYLGKTSTEARPQYTDNPASSLHNPKSNFLDTVRPPPPVVPAFQHRPYAAAYPIKPAPSNVPRTPVQQNIKPYSYKPKESMMHTFRPTSYTPDTTKNPNSPVAHQPNAYSYRAQGPQQGQYTHQTGYNNAYSQGHYVPYVPPQSSSSGWRPQMATSAAPRQGPSPYATTGQASPTLPPYPYGTPGSQALPPYPYQQNSGPMARPTYSQPAHHQPASSQPPRDGAPNSGPLSHSTGTSRPPMYATVNSSSTDSSAQSPSSQADYLAYVTKYPYLKNAFLRRAKTYISPYSPTGGFTPEWIPKPPTAAGPHSAFQAHRHPTSTQPQHQTNLGYAFSGPPQASAPVPRPTPQFQSADAFRQDIAKAPRIPIGTAPKWEHMFKQLNSATGSSSSPTPALSLAAGPSPTALQPLAPRPASTSQSSTPPVPAATSRSFTPSVPAPASNESNPTTTVAPSEPQRPIPSPLSDGSKSPARPEVSPISEQGDAPAGANSGAAEEKEASAASGPPKLLPPIHTAETWKYTQET